MKNEFNSTYLRGLFVHLRAQLLQCDIFEFRPTAPFGESRRILRGLEVDLDKLVECERGGRCGVEFVQAFAQYRLADVNDAHNVGESAIELEVARGQEESGATNACWASTHGHPVALHPSH